jgi:hypothetical protein
MREQDPALFLHRASESIATRKRGKGERRIGEDSKKMQNEGLSLFFLFLCGRRFGPSVSFPSEVERHIGGWRRNVGAVGFLDDYGVVGAVCDSKLSVVLHAIAVCPQHCEFGIVLSMPDASVVNQCPLVEAFYQCCDLLVFAIRVNATCRDLGSTSRVILHDSFGVEDPCAVAERFTEPAQLHISDTIGELAQENAAQCGLRLRGSKRSKL